MSVSATSVGPVQFSVVIPVHNEATALARLLDELSQELGKLMPGRWEAVVVDDGSTDGTSIVAGRPGVKVVSHPQRRGYGAAMKTGSRAAVGELIAWIDGDGTYSVQDLIAVWRALGTSDQVVGARSRDFGRLNFLRLTVKNCTARIASRLWGIRIPDLNSGLRLFRRASLHAWIEELPDGFSCTTTATLAALNHRQRVVFLPISYGAREQASRSKFHPVWDTLRLWRVVWRCWQRKGR